jgi:hypothetical protein
MPKRMSQDDSIYFVKRETFGERLKRLRRLHFSDDDAGEFRRLAKIAHTQFTSVEGGSAFLAVDALERWLTVCGTTLSNWFSDWESDEGRTRRKVKIVPGKEHLYEMLTTILESRNPRRIHGITVNLEDISAAAKAEMEASKQKPPKEIEKETEVDVPVRKRGKRSA